MAASPWRRSAEHQPNLLVSDEQRAAVTYHGGDSSMVGVANPPAPPPETEPPPEVPHASIQAFVARPAHEPEIRQSPSAQAALSEV